MIHVFLVDDQALVRAGLRLLLAAQPDLLIVGEASTGAELLVRLLTTPTQVVLFGVNSPNLPDFETIHQVRKQHPTVRLVVMSQFDQVDYSWQLLAAGVQGCLSKSASLEETLASLRIVAAGEQFLSTAIGFGALQQLHAATTARPTRALAPSSGKLSKRELDVLQLLAAGLTTGEIAEKLFLSKRTIETHRQHIMEKMQAKNAAALVKLALREGLLD